jgi:hypothetical protein
MGQKTENREPRTEDRERNACHPRASGDPATSHQPPKKPLDNPAGIDYIIVSYYLE